MVIQIDPRCGCLLGFLGGLPTGGHDWAGAINGSEAGGGPGGWGMGAFTGVGLCCEGCSCFIIDAVFMKRGPQMPRK